MKTTFKLSLLIINLIIFSSFKIYSQNAKWYISSNAGQPWGSQSNIIAMNTAFGAGQWNQGFFQTIPNMSAICQPSTCMIFIEGGDGTTTAFNTFLQSNLTILQNWVSAGGRLFINAAPNVGSNVNFGFGGVTLNYSGGSSDAQGNAAPGMAGHPIFNSPFTPAGLAYTGNSFSHAYVTGGGITNVIVGNLGLNPLRASLAELTWGSGMVMFGGITTNNFHSPTPNAQNLTPNILSYLNVCCVAPAFTPVATQTNICAGTSVTITAGVGNFTFNPGGIVGPFIVVTPFTNTNYSVSATSTAGCIALKTVSIAVSSPPNVALTSVFPTSMCSGSLSSVVFYASGATSYTLLPVGVSGVSPLFSTPIATTTYSLIGSNGGCVSQNIQTVTIFVNQTPLITINSGTICQGNSFTLNPSGASSYTFPGGSSIVSPTAPGIYSYSVTGANSGCQSTAISNLTVIPAPNFLAVASRTSICAKERITINAFGANSYIWSNGSTGSSISVTPLANTIYTVTGMDGTGCTSALTVSIQVNACTGISLSPLEHKGLIISPNPNSGLFSVNIDFVDSDTSIEIFNSLGQLVLYQKVDSEKNFFNLKNQPAGLYHVNVKSKAYQNTTKLVIE